MINLGKPIQMLCFSLGLVFLCFLLYAIGSRTFSQETNAAPLAAPQSDSCLKNLVGPSVFNGSSTSILITYTSLDSPQPFSDCHYHLGDVESNRDSGLFWDVEAIWTYCNSNEPGKEPGCEEGRRPFKLGDCRFSCPNLSDAAGAVAITGHSICSTPCGWVDRSNGWDRQWDNNKEGQNASPPSQGVSYNLDTSNWTCEGECIKERPRAVSCANDATFLADVTYPDGSDLPPNQSFSKVWWLKNAGTCAWGGYSLAFVNGAQMSGPSSVVVPTTPPGQSVDITVPLIAPAGSGIYQGTWKMKDAQGGNFGELVWVIISVSGPPVTPAPTPTSTPAPQPTDGIEICDGTNYGQPCKVFPEARYGNLADYGWYDRVESVRFLGSYRNNYHVVLYSEKDLTGDPGHYDGDASTLGNAQRNHVRSLEIYRTTSRDGIELCDGENYGSPCQFLAVANPEGKYADLNSVGFWDRAESVRFVGACSDGKCHAVLHSEKDFQGDPAHYDNDTPTLGNAQRNHVRSVTVYRHQPQPTPGPTPQPSPSPIVSWPGSDRTDFNGATEYVDYGTSSNYEFAAMTLVADVYVPPNKDYGAVVSKWDSQPDRGTFVLAVSSSTLSFMLKTSGGNETITANFSPTNSWVRVAATYDGNATATLYVNGLQVAQKTINNLTRDGNSSLVIGNTTKHTWQPFYGGIRNVAVYNQVVSSAVSPPTPTPPPTATPVPTATPTAVPTPTPTSTPTADAELLTSTWTLVGSNGDAQKDKVIPSNSLAGKTSAQVTFSLHGTCFGGGDDEASIVFIQDGDWRAANVTSFGAQNCLNGSQTVTIPLSSFHKVGNSGIILDPSQPVSNVHARFWNSGSFTVDITSIKLIVSGGGISPTPVPTPTATPTATPTPSSGCVELLANPWHLEGNNGDAQKYQEISPNVLQGKNNLKITYNLHGLNALGGDASAIIFDQGGWHYISLSNYGQNSLDGAQTVTIPLSDFGLDLSQSVGTLHTRFWYSSQFVVDISSVNACN